MTERRDDGAVDNGDFTNQFPSVVADDVFLTDLSEGVRPGDGEDDLADLLLGLRDEVEADLPAPPTLADLGLPPVAEGDGAGPAPDNVVPLRRPGTLRRGLFSGLIGAAAATLVIAGGGAVVYNAEPGSPFWGLSKTMFGDRAAVVELAGTLDELNGFAETGDVEGLRALLSDARTQLATDGGGRAPAATPAPAPVSTTTATVELEPRNTEPPTPEAVSETVTAQETIVERETVTETAVRTATVTTTVTVFPQVPVEPAPTQSAEPSAPAPTGVPTGTPQGN